MLFDEPTSALDPELVGEVLDVIKKLAVPAPRWWWLRTKSVLPAKWRIRWCLWSMAKLWSRATATGAQPSAASKDKAVFIEGVVREHAASQLAKQRTFIFRRRKA
jgi:hypothetical protein